MNTEQRKAATQAAKDAHRQLIEDLEQQVLNFRSSPQWTRLLEWQAKQPHRSANNNALIFMQMPDSTLCRGYRQWQSTGRQVRKGEPGIAIWAPVTRKLKEEDDEGRRFITGFKIAYIWDISQTDVFDTELDEIHNSSPIPTIEGESHLYRTLYDMTEANGIQVVETEMYAEGTAEWNSRTGQRRILLKADRPDAHKAIVMLHEHAHIALHQQREKDRILSAEQKEWEAESVAYIVATHYGLPTYSDLYLASWKVQKGDLTKLLSRISNCASELIEQIDAHASHAAVPQLAAA